MSKSSSGWKSIINLLAFVAIVCIALAITIGRIFPSLSWAFGLVAEVIAYSITATLAFKFARSRGHWAYFVIWIIAVVLIIVLKFIK